MKKTLRYLAVLAFLTAISVPASFADGGPLMEVEKAAHAGPLTVSASGSDPDDSDRGRSRVEVT